MNKYLKLYIRNRTKQADQLFFKNFNPHEVPYIDFNKIENKWVIRNSAMDNIMINADAIDAYLENETFYDIPTYYISDIFIDMESDYSAKKFLEKYIRNEKLLTGEYSIIERFIKNVVYDKNKDRVDTLIDVLLDFDHEIMPKLILSYFPSSFYKDKDKMRYIMQDRNFIKNLAKNDIELLRSSMYYLYLDEKERLFIYYTLLKYSNYFYDIEENYLYFLIYRIQYDFELDVRLSFIKLFINDKKIKDKLSDEVYGKILNLYKSKL